MIHNAKTKIRNENEGFLEEIEEKLALHPTPVTENILWETLAESLSPDWTTAKTELRLAENALYQLNKPENRPLGLIGCALAAEEINTTLDLHVQALTKFTIIDEELRQQKNVQDMLKILIKRTNLVEASIETSKATEALTQAFDTIAAAPRRKSLLEVFSCFAKEKFGPSKLQQQRLCTRRL